MARKEHGLMTNTTPPSAEERAMRTYLRARLDGRESVDAERLLDEAERAGRRRGLEEAADLVDGFNYFPGDAHMARSLEVSRTWTKQPAAAIRALIDDEPGDADL